MKTQQNLEVSIDCKQIILCQKLPLWGTFAQTGYLFLGCINSSDYTVKTSMFSSQVTKVDVEAELQTYKHSRQGLDEMYNEARRQLRDESQLRQVGIISKK